MSETQFLINTNDFNYCPQTTISNCSDYVQNNLSDSNDYVDFNNSKEQNTDAWGNYGKGTVTKDDGLF